MNCRNSKLNITYKSTFNSSSVNAGISKGLLKPHMNKNYNNSVTQPYGALKLSLRTPEVNLTSLIFIRGLITAIHKPLK